MTTTDISGLTPEAAALAVIGGTVFADTEVGLLQQLLIAVANA